MSSASAGAGLAQPLTFRLLGRRHYSREVVGEGLMPSLDERYGEDGVAGARLRRFAEERGTPSSASLRHRVAARSPRSVRRPRRSVGGRPPLVGGCGCCDRLGSQLHAPPPVGGRSRRRGGLHDDSATMRTVRAALESGRPRGRRSGRAGGGRCARQVADAETRLFHFSVHERLRAEVLGHDVVDARTMASDALSGSSSRPPSTSTAGPGPPHTERTRSCTPRKRSRQPPV